MRFMWWKSLFCISVSNLPKASAVLLSTLVVVRFSFVNKKKAGILPFEFDMMKFDLI